MGGSILFQDAFDARLKAINITAEKFQEMIDTKPVELSEGVEELVTALHCRNAHVYIISGGFIDAILPVSRRLNIPDVRIFILSINDFFCKF